MKKTLAISAILLVTHFAYAAEDECPAAVDVAEAQNPNAYKNCDYSKTGLNGVLHRALAGKDESGEEEKISKDGSGKVSGEKKQKTIEKVEVLKNGEFNSAQQLQSVKFALLENLTLECAKGFVVEGERYLPTINSKAMKLELIYHCL